MKCMYCLFFLVVVVAQHTAQGQGTIVITFDGPPYASGMTSYVESGMYFDPGAGNNGFGHGGLSPSPIFPDNGTLYLQGDGHSGYNNVTSHFIDGSAFGVTSVDVAAFGGGYDDFFIEFAAARSDGTRLTTSFSGTGIDFRTFYFGPEWSSGLTGIGWSNGDSPYGWSMDNLVVIVPEPSCGALFLTGTLTVLAFQRTRRRSK